MSGPRAIEAQVDPAVKSVEIVLDGKRVDVMRAPWQAKVDFGTEIAPHELTAIARDAEGREIARDTQYINLPRSHAEIGVMFQRNRADITWQHLAGVQPRKMTVTLNEKVLTDKVTNSVVLPKSSPSDLNVLTVDIEFKDGALAHRDVVFGGFSEELPTELTATLVHQKAEGRTDPANCFRQGTTVVPANQVEAADAAVFFVRAGTPPPRLHMPAVTRPTVSEMKFRLPGAQMKFIWPIAGGTGTTELFSRTDFVRGERGVRWLLTRAGGPPTKTPRFADAVAVAGMEALRVPRRRAVVLVVAGETDVSRYDPMTVRRYLERIGVELHVWTVTPRKTDERWGEAHDISKAEYLVKAVEKLRESLDRQRVAWLPVSPYEALHVSTAPDCAWEPLARLNP
ncbi:MAG TPA: hypothetical protein VNI54_01030 [Thermoanaerobaculia bacterium]|nr:hypothetical protein [Thermoanaerobaculia bacterium]